MATAPAVPAGSNTVNPFIVADAAGELIGFLTAVFDAEDVPEARTLDTDGLILHAELRIGDSLLTVADRKPDWPFTPALIRVYVDDADAVLARAERLGGRVVTRPTDFFGDTLARFQDPAGNLWWVYRHDPGAEQDWSEDADRSGTGEDTDWSAFATPGLEYVHATLNEAMGALRDTRA
ncbi:VOC family protein [Glycomyces sp. A-F 0318]|uniref:VOC family protein n=1 Tax=Glycomyces amatae TaxID=2881355 RepID=UPI001E5B9A3A|nr:VOC family protein [Glycomyces amatae]MCD0447279.1 VOC family protein [Glycomyces amatae]